jgi:hypothetical protein
MAQVAEPPIPSDTLEAVTGSAQPVTDATHRGEIVNLLASAHALSNVREYPYDLKTSFTVSGSGTSDGEWQMEDTSPGGKRYRWTARGPSYVAANVQSNRMLYSTQVTDSLPLRLAQVRGAIFHTDPVPGPRATLRTANGNINGIDVTCALIARNAQSPVAPGPRRWEEEEYCVDPKAGTLVTSSLAPGLYVYFDYSKALAFHDKRIANKFSISEAGHTVVEAQTEGVGDPQNDPAAFDTAGLNQIGVGPVMSAPWRIRSWAPFSPQQLAANPNAPEQIVVLHGMQSPDSHITDLEILASSDPSLNQAALDFAARRQGQAFHEQAEPGVTPQSHEVLITLQNPPLQR